MEENIQLPQLGNSVLIVGTLAKVNLEAKTSSKGNDMIQGDVTVAVKMKDQAGVMRTNEITVKVLAMKTSKLYKGVETVLREYKSIAATNRETADRIQISGNIGIEEWVSTTSQKLVSYNSIKGIFFTRLEKGTEEYEQEDKAQFSLDAVFGSFTQILDADQLPTGEHKTVLTTVGFSNEIIPIVDLVVADEIVAQAQNVYFPGCTASFSGNLLNYSEEVVTEVEAKAVQMAFGEQNEAEKRKERTPRNYTKKMVLTSGSMPLMEGAMTQEQINMMIKLRNVKLSELKNGKPAPATPPAAPPAMAFGSAPTGMNMAGLNGVDNDEDIPF